MCCPTCYEVGDTEQVKSSKELRLSLHKPSGSQLKELIPVSVACSRLLDSGDEAKTPRSVFRFVPTIREPGTG